MGYIYDWTRMSGAAASNDLIMLIDVSDKTDSAEGTNKLIEGRYLVQDNSGGQARVNNGGTIDLGGYTLTVADSGTLDLGTNTAQLGGNLTTGGALTTDGAVSLAGAVLTAGGQSLTISNGVLSLGGFTFALGANSTLNTNGNTLATTGGDVTIAAEVAGNTLTLNGDATLDMGGNTLTLTSAAALDLNGNTLTSDGNITAAGTTLNVGGETIDLAVLSQLPSITPGTDGRLAVWSGGGLGQSTVLQPATNVLTLQSDAANTLRMITGARLNMNDQTLNMTSPATLQFNNLTLTLTGGNVTITDGGTIDLNNNTVTFNSGGTLALNGQTLTVSGDNVTLSGGGTLNLAGYTLTAAKSGTVATTDDLAGITSSYWMPIWFGSYQWTSGSTYTTVGRARWLGSWWGGSDVEFRIGFNVTGTGTAKVKVVTGGSTPYEKIHSTGSSATYHESFWWIGAPATDQDILIQFSETSNSIYPHYCYFMVPQ